MTRTADQVLDHVELRQQGKHAHRALGHHGDHRRRNGSVEAIVFLAVADHDATLVGLSQRVHGVMKEGRDLLGDDDLALLGITGALRPTMGARRHVKARASAS